MITRIPAVLYRGGTSKGPLILASDLPLSRRTLDAVLLAAMGSPHKRQVDGIGGAETLTSKIAPDEAAGAPNEIELTLPIRSGLVFSGAYLDLPDQMPAGEQPFRVSRGRLDSSK